MIQRNFYDDFIRMNIDKGKVDLFLTINAQLYLIYKETTALVFSNENRLKKGMIINVVLDEKVKKFFEIENLKLKVTRVDLYRETIVSIDMVIVHFQIL
jgi:hypothetical protein